MELDLCIRSHDDDDHDSNFIQTDQRNKKSKK